MGQEFNVDIDELKRNFRCAKCGHNAAVSHELSTASGGFLNSFVGANTNTFECLACNRCGYTEFYATYLHCKN